MGNFEIIETGQKFLVKKMTINPGKRLSLQYHNHRDERWTIVQGTATITKDNEIITLKENKSVFIPKLMKHRAENQENIDLIFIEIWYGDHLNESDITRTPE